MCFCFAEGRGQKMGFNSAMWGDEHLWPCLGLEETSDLPLLSGKAVQVSLWLWKEAEQNPEPLLGHGGVGICLSAVIGCLKPLCVEFHGR